MSIITPPVYAGGSLLLLLAFVAPAQEPKPKLRIVCIGDSVTKAAGVKKEQSFCAVVEAQLQAAGYEAVVVNSGVGSDTTKGGLKRFQRDVLDHRPTHTFIMFGLNDAYRPKDKGPLVPLDDYVTNLKDMVAILRKNNIVPVLMTSNPYSSRKENVVLKPYIDACRAVARSEKATLADVYGRFAEYAIENDAWPRVYTDGLHLNPEGNRLVADLITQTVLSLVAKKKP